MGQMQNNNAMHMATLNMQNQRLADANARDDKRWAEHQAAQERQFAQQDKWKQQELLLQRDALNRQYAAMNKSQLVTIKGPYGEDVPVLFNPISQKVTRISIPDMGGDSSIPGLDAATSAGVSEVLSTGWSPFAGRHDNRAALYDLGVKAGVLPAPQANNSPATTDGMQGLTPMPSENRPSQGATSQPTAGLLSTSQPSMAELGQRAGVLPSPAQQTANTLAPGTIVDGSGKTVHLPDNVPWGKQEKQYVNGVEYYGARTPNGVYFKIGGPVPLTPTEKKDQRAVEKMDKMDAAAKQSGQNVLGMIQQARDLVNQGNLYGTLPNTGIGSLLNWIPGTTGKDLEATLDTIKANVGFDKLQQMRANSPTGAALGSVSDFENKMLQSVIASLATSQSKEQFLANLQRVEDTYNMIVHGPNYHGQHQAPSASSPQRLTFNPQTGRLE